MARADKLIWLLVAVLALAVAWNAASSQAEGVFLPAAAALLVALPIAAFRLGQRHSGSEHGGGLNAVVVRLQQEQGILRTFFRALPDMAWIKDAEGRYLACNPLFEEFCGFREDQVIGQTDFAFVDQELAAFFRQKDQEAILADRPRFNEEWITYASDGRRALMETVKAPIRDAEGRPVAVLGIAHDITAHRYLEDSLRASRHALEEAQRIARIGSWQLDLADNRMEWSDEVFRILEVDPKKNGASWDAVMAITHPDDRERLGQCHADCCTRRTPFDIQHRLLMADGRIKHVHGRCEIPVGEDGTPLRAIGTIQDITAAREAADRLEESRRLLQELTAHREEVREEERRRIALNLHEELGQLLGSLRMGLSVQRVWTDPAAFRERLPALLSQVDLVIDGLREAVAELRPNPLNMGIIPALEWLVLDFSKNQGIECTFHGIEGIDLSDPRATALFRIVQESLGNVARHSGADRADVFLEREGAELVLRVRDKGKGFDPLAPRPKTFGLLGIWERSAMLGGHLDIRSAPGQGTEIILRFPA